MSSELEPLAPVLKNLPAPLEFGQQIKAKLDEEILRVRTERGPITDAADTHALIRSLEEFRTLAGDYARGLTGAAKVAQQVIQEELTEAVGEQDGIPNSSMAVPDTDGTTIRLTLDAPNVHTMDVEALRGAVAAVMLDSHDVVMGAGNLGLAVALADTEAEAKERRGELESFLAEVLVATMEQFVSLGTFSPQVSKVKAFKTSLGATGHDGLAAVVGQAIRTTKDFKGIKISRETPK